MKTELTKFALKNNTKDLLDSIVAYANSDDIITKPYFITLDREELKPNKFYDRNKAMAENRDKLIDYLNSRNIGIASTDTIRNGIETRVLENNVYLIDPSELGIKVDKFYEKRVMRFCKYISRRVNRIGHCNFVLLWYDDNEAVSSWYKKNKSDPVKEFDIDKCDPKSKDDLIEYDTFFEKAIKYANSNSKYAERLNTFITIPNDDKGFNDIIKYIKDNSIGVEITNKLLRQLKINYPMMSTTKYMVEPEELGIKNDLYFCDRIEIFGQHLKSIVETGKRMPNIGHRYTLHFNPDLSHQWFKPLVDYYINAK